MLDAEPYPKVTIDGWNPVGKAKVFYASPGNRSLRNWIRLIRETPHDVLYLNSFFSPAYTMLPLLARRLGLIPKRPTILAPRGELSGGTLALKFWKKKTYIVVGHAFGFYDDVIWHVTSHYEDSDLKKIIGSSNKRTQIASVIASDLPTKFDNLSLHGLNKERVPDEPFRVCFLSRITPKKNLDYALRVLDGVKVPIAFSIYGTIEDKSHWRHCQKLIKSLPAHVFVHYYGAIDHRDVAQELARHDLFFLPTRGENYGHVIFEAMASGLPVLISDQTPWRNLEEVGVGWDISLKDMAKFRAVLEAQVEVNGKAKEAQRLHVKQFAKRVVEDKKVLLANLKMFQDLIPHNS